MKYYAQFVMVYSIMALVLPNHGWSEVTTDENITIEKAVQEALEKNLELRIKTQGLGMAQGALINARMFPNPELELTGESDVLFSNEGESQFSVGLGQKILVGPKRRYRTKIAELNVGRIHRNIENTRRLLIADVKGAFYALLLIQERVKQGDELIEINQRLVELSEGRFREGYAPELDLNLAKIQFQRVRGDRVELEIALSDARAGLNFLLGRPAFNPVVARGEFSKQELELDPAHLTEGSITERPDLKAQEVELTMAGTALELEKVERLPDVTLSVDYSQERSVLSELNFTDTGRLIGLKLTVPIPLFNRNQGKILQAKFRRDQIALERDLLRTVIEREVTRSEIKLRVALQTLKRFRDAILPLSENHFKQTEAAYAKGQASILDVMEAQRRFSEARLGALEAQYGYSQAFIELEREMGTALYVFEIGGSQEEGLK